jgi:hypothetical protein
MPKSTRIIKWYDGTHMRFPEIVSARDYLQNGNDLSKDEKDDIE